MAGTQKILPRLRAAYRAFQGQGAPVQPSRRQLIVSPRGHASQYFEGAETNRLNEESWAHASDADINWYLQAQLQTLRARCRYMERQDGYARGLLETYATMVLGPNGPALQVESENAEFAKALEAEWDRFRLMPDAAEMNSLTELLRLALDACWTDGEFLWQTYFDVDGVRVNDIDVSRLVNYGAKFESGNHTLMGVERTSIGRPVAYHVSRLTSTAAGQTASGEAQRVDARYMLHRFQPWYTNQGRGIPWMSPGLTTFLNIKEYAESVQAAAKTASDMSVIYAAKNPDEFTADFEAPAFLDLEHGSAVTAPAGHEPFQLKAEQPTTTFKEFEDEMLRRVGRVKGVPLLLIKLDAGSHNMASARFTSSIFQAHVRWDQQWVENRLLRVLLQKVAEWLSVARFRGALPVYKAKFIHSVVPSSEPYKDAQAADLRLHNRTTTLSREIANYSGADYEMEILQQEREITVLSAGAGPMGPYASAGGATATEPDADETADDEAQDKEEGEDEAAA